jgi:Helix-hairpin-helix motif
MSNPELAERVFKQIEGFGSYGFPESHAASFAHLAYASSWLKCHHPAVFAAALLSSQPMGFYAPAQIVGDAKKHAGEVRPVDINASDWDSTLEPEMRSADQHALRLASGLAEEEGRLIVKVRRSGNGSPYGSVEEVARRTVVSRTLGRADEVPPARSGIGARETGPATHPRFPVGLFPLPPSLAGPAIEDPRRHRLLRAQSRSLPHDSVLPIPIKRPST